MTSSHRKGLSRRAFLQAGLAAGSTLAAPALLTACGSSGEPPSARWRNWSGSQTSNPKQWLNPPNESALMDQIRTTQGPIRVTGASHSFSAVCRTEDTLISIDHLKGLISHDPVSLQARVWAGTRLRDLGDPLWAVGQSLINQGDVDPQSVAGACGTSTHGTGAALGSFSSVARALRIVTPQGDVVEADASRNRDVFHAGCTSLGVLGVVTQITLQNRNAYKLHEREYLEDLDTVLRKLPEYVKENRHFEFFAFFETDMAIVKRLNESSAEDTPSSRFNLPVDGVLDLSAKIAHGIPGMDGPMQKMLMALHTESDRVGRSYRIFPSPRNSRFNEMEYELPLAQGPDCLREILEVVRKSRVRTLFPVEYRTVAGDDAWLSPFYGRDSASISIHQFHTADYRPLFDLVEPLFWKYGGRPHWGKLHTLSARELAPLYPRWDDFQKVRKSLDPKGRMLNDHLRRALIP